EVGDVRVLLGLGHVQLVHPARGERLGERRRRTFGREGDRVGPALLVLGEGRQPLDRRRPAAPGPAGQLLIRARLTEPRLGEGPDELAHAVGAEVEAQDAVAGTDARLLAYRRRLDELIGLATLVGLAHRLLSRVRAVRALAVREHVVRP